MRAFLQKQNQPRRASSNITRSSTVAPAASHPAHPILHLQRTIRNQAVQRLLGQAEPDDFEARFSIKEVTRFAHKFSQIPVHATSPAGVQAKLTVSAPGDSYEQEADRASEQVMRSPEPQLQHACPCSGGCTKCQTEQPGREHESLQTERVHAGDMGHITAPPIVHGVLASPGQPLDLGARGFMEPRFGSTWRNRKNYAAPRPTRTSIHARAIWRPVSQTRSRTIWRLCCVRRSGLRGYRARRLASSTRPHTVSGSGLAPRIRRIAEVPNTQISPRLR
jgi:hypothetical protein